MAGFAEFALRRSYRNGNRFEPLSIEELAALQQSTPLVMNVKMIHGDERLSICCDPATTAEEACLELAQQKGITQPFGWSLFAECKQEVESAEESFIHALANIDLQGYSLGFNKDHVFNILSRLEMSQIQKGEDSRNLDVTFIFCKQLFAPWENIDEDPKSIELIYDQIINGRRARVRVALMLMCIVR